MSSSKEEMLISRRNARATDGGIQERQLECVARRCRFGFGGQSRDCPLSRFLSQKTTTETNNTILFHPLKRADE